MSSSPKPHHHGALRPELIAAGRAILTEGRDLTLRQAAARAGVSHAAPAHHFGNLAGLRGAIATEAFAEFTAAMESRHAALPPGATDFDRLLAICLGYLDFARDKAGLFALMFNSDDIDRSDPALHAAGQGSYDVLARACRPFATGPEAARRLETAVWSLVHGYAALRFDAMIPEGHPVAGGAPEFSEVLSVLLCAPSPPT